MAAADVVALNELAASFWERLLQLQPWIGTVVGDERYDDRLHDPGPAGREAVRNLLAQTLTAADGLDAADQPTDAAITAQLLTGYCRLQLDKLEQREDLLMAASHLAGPQAWLTMLVQMQPADTDERLVRLLARLAAFRGYVTAHVEVVREAATGGIVQPQIVAQRTIGQLQRLIDAGAAGSPVVAAARVADDEARERVAQAVAEHVLPAYQQLLDVIRADYLPRARPEPGLVALPDGAARYALAVREWTGLPLAPDALHERGWQQLAALDRERHQISRAVGLGDDMRAYRDALTRDPTNVPTSEDALLGRMRDDVGRGWEAARRAFGRLPAAECRIEPLDHAQAGDSLGYYHPPTPQTGLPGVFYMNTTNLAERLFSRYATITYHEAVPGHHLQLALEAETPAISPFRRFVGHGLAGAFTEGWGLYAERLADELGLFRNQQERFGMLDSQAWRAARLVVDTGIHAFGWDRRRAIATLIDATGFDEPTATVEVDRYIGHPGQALAYKVGQAEIERLRDEATNALGSRFELRAFHDALIGNGSLPLPIAVGLARSTLGLPAAAERWPAGAPTGRST